jgi:hypothetical protein
MTGLFAMQIGNRALPLNSKKKINLQNEVQRTSYLVVTEQDLHKNTTLQKYQTSAFYCCVLLKSTLCKQRTTARVH